MDSRCSMVVFDMAGTTVRDEDNAVAGTVQKALAEFGCPIELTDVDPVMGMPKPLAVRHLLEQFAPPGKATDERVQAAHARFQEIIVAHYRDGENITEIDGASDIFRILRENDIKVTLDTGFDRRTLDTIVNRLGWADLLDATVASDEVENGRPAPDMIRVLMDRCGVSDPASVCKVGDSVSDIEQGVNAGCGLVAAVLCERTRDAWQSHTGVIAIERLEDLLPHLGIEVAEPVR